jgi:hypothetical protein
VGDYRAINLELELFNTDIRDKPQVTGGGGIPSLARPQHQQFGARHGPWHKLWDVTKPAAASWLQAFLRMSPYLLLPAGSCRSYINNPLPLADHAFST